MRSFDWFRSLFERGWRRTAEKWGSSRRNTVPVEAPRSRKIVYYGRKLTL